MIFYDNETVIDESTDTVIEEPVDFTEEDFVKFAYYYLCSHTDIVLQARTRVSGGRLVEDIESSPYSKLCNIFLYDIPFSRDYFLYLVERYKLLDCGALAKW